MISLLNSLTKVDDFIFTCTVSCIDSKNTTTIIRRPVSSAELNVKRAFIFSLYRNFSIFSDQYIHIYQAKSKKKVFKIQFYCSTVSFLLKERIEILFNWLSHFPVFLLNIKY